MSVLDNDVMEAISRLEDSIKLDKASPSKMYSDDGCRGDSCSDDCDYSCSDDDECNFR